MAESGGRRIGVAVDFSECSKKALNWAIDNVVRDGDYLILITVAPNMNYEEGEMQLWETVGSLDRLCNMLMKPVLAPALIPLSEVSEASITVVMKIFGEILVRRYVEAVEHIPLSSLVIDKGSVSNHVVNNVACPVTVVKAHH
ncbi:hypothetical protein HID58_092335 [Brassica napus]|uniref:UspA domain-containing protein n=1 Tax=Brassica napus TaxID=3708 RepID=A0ABQ7WXB5_BRANA|nr:hypothetical protein HID58_092335 [Brassica napus]